MSILDELASNVNVPDVGEAFEVGSFASRAGTVLVAALSGFGLISIAYGFVQYVLSQGQPDKTKKAFQGVLYGVISVALAVVLITIGRILMTTIGVDPEPTDLFEIQSPGGPGPGGGGPGSDGFGNNYY